MQTAFIQTVDMFVFVLIVLQREAKFVVQMAKPTNIPANFKRMPARKTRAFQLFHRVDVQVRHKQLVSLILVSNCPFAKGTPPFPFNRLSLGPRERWLWTPISGCSWILGLTFAQNPTLVLDLIHKYPPLDLKLYNIRGKITELWLVKTEGIFS